MCTDPTAACPPAPLVTRRAFVLRAVALGAGVGALPCAACDGGPAGAETSSAAGVTVLDREIRIDLPSVPELRSVPGFLRVPAATAVVLRVGAADYRAFSAVARTPAAR